MSTDFRALCAELLMALENAISIIYCEDGTKHISTAKPIVNRARAALADEPAAPEGREPAAVTGPPSDEDLRDLWSWAAGQDQGPWPTQHHCFARAVLARWGNPLPAPPAEGEVAELVAWLRMQGEAQKPGPKSLLSTKTKKEMHANGSRLIRAAELLQRQTMPEVGE